MLIIVSRHAKLPDFSFVVNGLCIEFNIKTKAFTIKSKHFHNEAIFTLLDRPLFATVINRNVVQLMVRITRINCRLFIGHLIIQFHSHPLTGPLNFSKKNRLTQRRP